MSERNGKAEKPGELVLIGDYLRDLAEAAPGGDGPRILPALLDAIVRYALYPEQPGLARFAEDLRRLAGQLEGQPPPASAGSVIEATIGLLGAHRRAKDELDEKQVHEIQAMVVMFQRSVAALTQGSHRSVDRLLTLEKDLRQASGLSDLVALRGRLGNVLEFVRKEREEERSRSTQVIEVLQQDFRQAQSALMECGVGMPGREQAIATLKRVWREGSVGAMLRLDQMAQVSERHGNETAQSLLLALLEAISHQIPLPYSTFRWSPSAVLLLLERTGDRDQARRLVRQKAALIPAAFMIEVSARKTLFRCPHNWFVLGSDQEESEAAAISRFEVFLRSTPDGGLA
jgi:hypothetical protein